MKRPTMGRVMHYLPDRFEPPRPASGGRNRRCLARQSSGALGRLDLANVLQTTIQSADLTYGRPA
jgi:hypothetical protein